MRQLEGLAKVSFSQSFEHLNKKRQNFLLPLAFFPLYTTAKR